MTAWTKNRDWDGAPAKTEFCGRVSDRFIPCAHERPCPIHDSPASEPGASSLPSVSPAPRFFDSVEAE